MPRSRKILDDRARMSAACRLVNAGSMGLLAVGEDGAAFLKGRDYTKMGVIAALPSTGNPLVDAYWEMIGIGLPAGAAIRVVSLLPEGDAGVARALEANGVTVKNGAARTLVVTDDYLRPEIAELAAESRELLLARPVGQSIWVGPLVVKGETVCYRCLAHWLRVNRWAQSAVVAAGLDSYARQPGLAALPSTLALGASVAATQAALWIARGDLPDLRGTILAVDTRDLRSTHHRVRPAPGCRCLELAPAPSLDEFVSPVCGIVSRMEVSANEFAGFHFARAQAATPEPVAGARPHLRPVAVAGRGTGRAQAERSCIGESVERYSAIFQGSEPRITAKWSELGAKAIDPRRLFLFSERQYAQREERNRTRPDLAWVPVPWDPETAIDWTQAQSFDGGEPLYVPSAYCYLWHKSAAGEIYRADSNGCAAGPDLESAALRALLELIERDALSIWWDNRLVRPAWALEELGKEELLRCRDGLAREGRELVLLDITTDLNVPVCAAVAAKRDGSEPYFAASAGLDAADAASRAASELAYLLWCGEDLAADYWTWMAERTLSGEAYLAPVGTASQRRAGDGLGWCLERLKAAGLGCWFVELTRPETRVPATRAIVPGLRHPWGRHAPGRLYEVPVRMGWRERACAEEELNPSTCLL